MPLNLGGPTRPPERRREEVDKLMTLLKEVDLNATAPKDRAFYAGVKTIIADRGVLTEEQIAWLRDLVERYA